MRCARPDTPTCQPGETLVENTDGGCCAPTHKCVATADSTRLYTSCGLLPFLPSGMGGPRVATKEDIAHALSQTSDM